MRKYFILTALLVIFIFSVGLKIYYSYQNPKFNGKDDCCLFWAESALHYHYAKTLANGSSIPDIDERTQHPEGLDIKRRLTIFMEYAAAFTFRSLKTLGINSEFHVFLVWFVAIFSSLTIFVNYKFTVLLWKSSWAGLVSAAFYAASPAFFSRTIGNYLREDFALLFLFLAIFLYFRSVFAKKTGSLFVSLHEEEQKKSIYEKLSIIFSGIFWGIALLAWHVSRFIWLVCWLLILALFLLDIHKNRKFVENALWMAVIPFGFGLIFPVLRASNFLFSTGMIITYVAFILFVISKKLCKLKYLLIIGVAALSIGFILKILISPDSTYSHVFNVFFYKIRFLLQKPTDPSRIPFEANIMWTASFNTHNLLQILYLIGAFFPILIYAIAKLNRLIPDSRRRFLLLSISYFLIINAGFYILWQRMIVFLIFFLTIFVAGVVTIRKKMSILMSGITLMLILVQSLTFGTIDLSEDAFFPSFQSEKLELVRWIKENTDETAVFLTRFATGPMILAYADRAINLQPKFEARGIRQKVENFRYSLAGDEQTFYRFCQDVDADYFLYEAGMALERDGDSMRYSVGLETLTPEHSMYYFHFFPDSLRHFTLCYQNNFFRLYKIDGNGEKSVSDAPTFDPKLFDLSFGEPLNDENAEKFIRDYEQAIQHNNSGVAYVQNDKTYQATQEFEKAIELIPSLKRPTMNLIAIHLRRREFAEAERLIEKLLSYYPEDKNLKNLHEDIRRQHGKQPHGVDP